MGESLKKRRARTRRILEALHELYPDATTALEYQDPFQLLVATILSAQTTDVRVNQVTPALFDAYPGPAELAGAQSEELEALIHPTGFYRNKAKNLKAMAAVVHEQQGDRVPRTRDELVELPGVGRKTANVVLGNAFDIPAVAVDTHVRRVSGRLELTEHREPNKIERDLMELSPEAEWTFLSHGLILHGRQVCKARGPACDRCDLRPDCPWPDQG